MKITLRSVEDVKQKTLRRREDDAAGLAEEVEAGGEGEDAADEDEAKLQIRFVPLTTRRDSCLRQPQTGLEGATLERAQSGGKPQIRSAKGRSTKDHPDELRARAAVPLPSSR